jgi:hypothetical protein
MRIQGNKPDHFDLHRKDHAGRPFMISAAFLGSIAVWAAVIAVAIRLF